MANAVMLNPAMPAVHQLSSTSVHHQLQHRHRILGPSLALAGTKKNRRLVTGAPIVAQLLYLGANINKNIVSMYVDSPSGSVTAGQVNHEKSGFGVEDGRGKGEEILLSRVDSIELEESAHEELLDEQDRITGALQIGVVRLRRRASWVCFGGGKRPRRPRAWKTKNRRGSNVKSQKLVDLIATLPSTKEAVYGGLDTWVAWEIEFPIITIKKALCLLRDQEEWKRVIQVTKWMLSKGQGKTLGTYHLLLEALDQEGRVEEADTLWEKILTENEAYTPRMIFTTVIAMFERHNKSKRVLQVFADMEELEVRPDNVTVHRVANTYRSLGLLKRADQVIAKYPPPQYIYRFIKGKRIKLRLNQSGDTQSEEGQEDSLDSDYDDDDSSLEEDREIDQSETLEDDHVLSSGITSK